MNIGVIGPVGPDLFAENIIVTLRAMGHSVTALGSVRRRPRRRELQPLQDLAYRSITFEQHQQRRLPAAVRQYDLRLVISVESALLPGTVAAIRSAGAQIVLWFPDHLANLDRQLMLLAEYDALFFKDPILVERLVSLLALPVHYLPEACNPMWHRPPMLSPDPTAHLVLAGNMYPSRVVLLDRLVAAGIPLRLYGYPFARWIPSRPAFSCHTGEMITRADKARIYRSAAGVLNNLHPSELTGVNCRLFEAAGSGGAVLCEDRAALADLFTPGSEVLPFTTFDELVDQARTLLADPEASNAIGDAAARRAHLDHTYELRLARIFDVLGHEVGRAPSPPPPAGSRTP